MNFNDAGDRKTRVGSSGSGSTDVYVDLSLTNQQVQIPAGAKLVRKDTATNNFDAQEYVTKAYASSLLGAMVSADGTKAQVLD